MVGKYNLMVVSRGNLEDTMLTHFAIMCLFSDYYNTAARIIVLMEETCNMFIEMARKFLDPGSIFQIEVKLKYHQKKRQISSFLMSLII